MDSPSPISPNFVVEVAAATNQARLDTLRAGVPVFYRDDSGIELMEYPDGRRFEIRYIPGDPSGHTHEILRELRDAA